MRIDEWGYKQEITFFKDATSSAAIKEKFKEFNATLITKVVNEYIKSYNLPPQRHKELFEICLNTFNPAFQKYNELFVNDLKPPYLFSTYFLNWIRKAIENTIDK